MAESLHSAVHSAAHGAAVYERDSLSARAIPAELVRGFGIFFLSFCSLFVFAIVYVAIVCSGIAAFWSMLTQV